MAIASATCWNRAGMRLPYVEDFGGATTIAQASAAACLTALLWHRPLKPRFSNLLMAGAVWMPALLPAYLELQKATTPKPHPDTVAIWLAVASVLSVLATVLGRPRWPAIPAIVLALGAFVLQRSLKDSDLELAGFSLLMNGTLIALKTRADRSEPAPAPPADAPEYRRLGHLSLLFVVGGSMLLAAVVAHFVLLRFNNSGDEWADTYQADLFAHGMAYAPVPECPDLFLNYWVFFYEGRAFAQYTPGWPLVMAPFQRLGLGWLASPFVFAALVWGTLRLAARCARGLPGADARDLNVARVLAVAGLLGASMLLNAGSRYPHVLVCACAVWAMESVCVLGEEAEQSRWLWGLMLGASTGLMLATRAPDAAALGTGVFVVFVYFLIRRKVGWRGLVAVALGFALWIVPTLIILRLQLGVWFKSGYQIQELFFKFGKPMFTLPAADEFRFGIPLATGSYSWWPAAPALALIGFIAMRKPARAAGFMLGLGAFLVLLLYTMLSWGRHEDAGYGPRYHLTLVPIMAVAAAVAFTPLFREVMKRYGPATLVALAMLVGLVRIAPTMYPRAYNEVRDRSATFRAIEKAKLKNAVVLVAGGNTLSFDPKDLAQNLASVKNPDVYVLVKHDWQLACGVERFPERKWYRAVGLKEVTLVPYDPVRRIDLAPLPRRR